MIKATSISVHACDCGFVHIDVHDPQGVVMVRASLEPILAADFLHAMAHAAEAAARTILARARPN